MHIHAHVQLARLALHGLPPVFRLTPTCSTCGPTWLATQSTIPREAGGLQQEAILSNLVLLGRTERGHLDDRVAIRRRGYKAIARSLRYAGHGVAARRVP